MSKMWRCRKDGKSGAVCVRLASIHGDSPDDEIMYVMAEDSGTAQEIATERFDAVEGEMRCYSEQLRRYNKKKGLRMTVSFDAAGLEVMGDVHTEAVAAKAQALVNAEEIERLHAQLTQVSLSLGATQGQLNLVDSLLHSRTDRLSPEVRIVLNTTQPPGSDQEQSAMSKQFWSNAVQLKKSGTQVPQEGPKMPGGPHLWKCWYTNVDTKEITCKCLGKQKASFAAFRECIVLAYRGSEAEELAKERLALR